MIDCPAAVAVAAVIAAVVAEGQESGDSVVGHPRSSWPWGMKEG